MFDAANQRSRIVGLVVGELRILAEMEGPCQAVRAQFPAFGQARLQLEVVVVSNQRLPDLKAGVGEPEILFAVDEVAIAADRDLLFVGKLFAFAKLDVRRSRVLCESGVEI